MNKIDYASWAPKHCVMTEQAEKIISFGKDLNKIIEENYKSEAGTFSGLTVPILKSIAAHCENALVILNNRLDDLYKTHKPQSYVTYMSLSEADAAVRRLNFARECDHFISENGSEQFNNGWEALDLAAVNSKSNSQMQFFKELVVLGTGVFSHSAGMVVHAATLLADWEVLTKAKQLELGLNSAAIAVRALDNLYKNIEDICLFLYLIPEPSDALNSINEKEARVRFRKSIGLI